MVPGCSHTQPKGSSFCPTCGEKSQTETHVLCKGCKYDEDNDRYKWGKFDVATGGYESSFQSDFHGGTLEYYVGINSVSTDYDHNIGQKSNLVEFDSNALLAELKKLLEPHGLFDADSFGLWTILYVN